MKEYIAKAVDGKDLTQEEAKKAMEIMLSGEATQAQIGAFLMALRMKGETLDELTGFAGVLCGIRQILFHRNFIIMWIWLEPVETVLILLIFLPLLHLSLQQQDFR